MQNSPSGRIFIDAESTLHKFLRSTIGHFSLTDWGNWFVTELLSEHRGNFLFINQEN